MKSLAFPGSLLVWQTLVTVCLCQQALLCHTYKNYQFFVSGTTYQQIPLKNHSHRFKIPLRVTLEVHWEEGVQFRATWEHHRPPPGLNLAPSSLRGKHEIQLFQRADELPLKRITWPVINQWHLSFSKTRVDCQKKTTTLTSTVELMDWPVRLRQWWSTLVSQNLAITINN